jgi:hypothetical protein
MLTRLLRFGSYLILTLGCRLPLNASSAPPGDRPADFTQAVENARQSGKQNLVLFTGLEWEEWSRRLQAEVLAKPEFAETLAAGFVLTHVDLPQTPRTEGELSESEARRYTLARNFHLQVLPSIYLCTPDGRPYGLVGYREGGPHALVDEIEAKRAAYDAVAAKVARLEGPERAREIDAWLQTIPEPLRTLHSDKIQAIAESDPDDSTGLRSKYRILLLLPEARRLRYATNLDRAEKLYLEILREQHAEGEARQDLYYELADVYFQRRDYDTLLDTLDQAIAAAPEGPRMPVLKEMMDVFTRQWIYTQYDPDRMKAADYDLQRLNRPPDGTPQILRLIAQAKTVAPASMRNRILERMEHELKGSAPRTEDGQP